MTKYVKMDDIMQFPIRRDHYDRENGDPHFINGVESVMEYIETLPTIDAVPVIRCKVCLKKRLCSLYREAKQESGFCAWGVREE